MWVQGCGCGNWGGLRGCGWAWYDIRRWGVLDVYKSGQGKRVHIVLSRAQYAQVEAVQAGGKYKTRSGLMRSALAIGLAQIEQEQERQRARREARETRSEQEQEQKRIQEIISGI